jgi:hypothetical protein
MKPRPVMVSKRTKQLDVSRTLLQTIVKNDFKLKPYKNQKLHGVADAQKAEKVQKCQQLLAWCAYDEKLFLLQETHNQENIRVFFVSLKDITQKKIAVKRV